MRPNMNACIWGEYIVHLFSGCAPTHLMGGFMIGFMQMSCARYFSNCSMGKILTFSLIFARAKKR